MDTHCQVGGGSGQDSCLLWGHCRGKGPARETQQQEVRSGDAEVGEEQPCPGARMGGRSRVSPCLVRKMGAPSFLPFRLAPESSWSPGPQQRGREGALEPVLDVVRWKRSLRQEGTLSTMGALGYDSKHDLAHATVSPAGGRAGTAVVRGHATKSHVCHSASPGLLFPAITHCQLRPGETRW